MKRTNTKKVRMEQSRRPKKNPLKAAGIEKVDYKDINTLRQFIPIGRQDSVPSR